MGIVKYMNEYSDIDGRLYNYDYYFRVRGFMNRFIVRIYEMNQTENNITIWFGIIIIAISSATLGFILGVYR